MSPPKITWQQAAQQMYNNFDAILIESDRDFISAVVMLAESGESLAHTALARLTKIYTNYLTLVNTKTSENLTSEEVQLQTHVPWPQMVAEMNDNTLLVMDDDDKQFVQGIALLLEMGEPIDPSYVRRIEGIYKKFRYHQDL